MSDEEDFESSQLGTKAHWDRAYEKEWVNFEEYGDIGEVWFGEDNVEEVIEFIQELKGVSSSSSILDLGCGNGYTLVEMAKRGFTHLWGCDYSEQGIQLAQKIAENEGVKVTYFVQDILSPFSDGRSYELIHDRGTFDAIALSEDSKANRERYLATICSILVPNGHFVITSCNFTSEELKAHFERGKLKKVGSVAYPTLEFGGRQGSRVSTLAFRKLV